MTPSPSKNKNQKELPSKVFSKQPSKSYSNAGRPCDFEKQIFVSRFLQNYMWRTLKIPTKFDV